MVSPSKTCTTFPTSEAQLARRSSQPLTAIAIGVKSEVKGDNPPVGIQILAGANIEAMAVAHAAGLDFIRAEGYAYAHVADEGLIQASAAQLLRYRRMIGATQ